MEVIHKLLLFCAFVALFVIRIFIKFPWVSSLALAGLFCAILDILSHIWNDNSKDKIKHHNLYILFIFLTVLIEIILIVLAILNIATPIIDSAIPYQYLGKALSMSNEQFQKLTEDNKPLIEKILYIKKNRHAQRTEEASLLLNCLDEIENREVKVVVLAHAITILGASRFPVGRREIDSIIREIDEKIKELESKEDDE